MTEVRLKPQYTHCPQPWGNASTFDDGDLTRHAVMIRDLGKCRMCQGTQLYAGDREEMLEKLSTAFLALYVDQDEAHGAEAVWGIDDLFFVEVMNLSEEELPPQILDPDADLEVDYDTEGLRIVRQALLRAAGKIEAHLNAAGEDV